MEAQIKTKLLVEKQKQNQSNVEWGVMGLENAQNVLTSCAIKAWLFYVLSFRPSC